MEDIEKADLNQVAIVQSRDYHQRIAKGRSLVEANMMVNAHAAGFYMAACFVREPRSLFHWLPLRKRVRPLHPVFDRKMAGWAVEQHISARYPGALPRDKALIDEAVREGFALGGNFMWSLMSQRGWTNGAR